MNRYLDLYPNSLSLGEGLFSALSETDVPWATLDAESKSALEIAYGLRSGNKVLMSLFTQVSENNRVKFLKEFYLEKWTKLWNDYKLEYSPLDGYVVNETGSNTKTLSKEETTTFGKKVNETGTDTGTVGVNGSTTSNGTDSIYGFNSSEAVPADSNQDSDESTSTETRDLEATRSTTNSGEDVLDGTESENGNYTIKKTGNIGYTTPQEMLRQDFELWKEPYFNQVFEDIDRYIMLSICV